MKYIIGIILAVVVMLPLSAHAAEVLDSDHDGLSDALEISLGTNIAKIDSDGDGFTDDEEVANGFNPLKGYRDRSLARRVEVDRTTQKLTYFLNNVPVRTIPVSTGVLWRETPVV